MLEAFLTIAVVLAGAYALEEFVFPWIARQFRK